VRASRSFWDLLRDSGGLYESTVSGASMEPTLLHGERVRIRPLPPGTYREGEVVACILKDEIFAHRIVYGTAQAIVTRGDNRILCDPPTAQGEILGLVSEVWRGGAWAVAGPQPPSRHPRLTALNLAMLRACMALHFDFARAVAGTTLHVGRFLRLARGAARPGPSSGA